MGRARAEYGFDRLTAFYAQIEVFFFFGWKLVIFVGSHRRILPHSLRLVSSNAITRSTLPVESKMRTSPVRSRARGSAAPACLRLPQKHRFDAGSLENSPKRGTVGRNDNGGTTKTLN